MNTISMTVNMTTATLKPRVQLGSVNEWLAGRTHPVLVHKQLRVPKTKAVVKSAWVSPQSSGFTRTLLYGLLVLSVLAGIAVGLLSVLERVQNWPVFNAWVGQILGA